MKQDEAYGLLFNNYPDVINVKQMCEMLGGISEKTGYRLLHTGKVKFFTIGRSCRIAKIHLIDYIAAENKIAAK